VVPTKELITMGAVKDSCNLHAELIIVDHCVTVIVSLLLLNSSVVATELQRVFSSEEHEGG